MGKKSKRRGGKGYVIPGQNRRYPSEPGGAFSDTAGHLCKGRGKKGWGRDQSAGPPLSKTRRERLQRSGALTWGLLQEKRANNQHRGEN